jgi:hypothetical protein
MKIELLAGKSELKIPFGRPRSRLEIILNLILKE